MPSKRKLTQQEALTKSQDLAGFMKEFGVETNRAAAILGAALLDELLSQLISNFLIDDDKEVRNLLDVERPLGAFGARIRAAYCLGLITNEVFQDLNVIKSIRNLFAHGLHGLSFEAEQVRRECAKLQSLERVHLVNLDSSSPRARFMISIYLIQTYLVYEIKTVIRCQTPESKVDPHQADGSSEDQND
jgi:DNA-binding MltR family transcriptional regulator